uniref:Uncharacterized protein n=1 Tax=viral metagenome TaxID=1070528 RepID=A0A6C0E733_9ZZZZ
MVGREYGSSTGYVGVSGYSTGGVPIDDNRTPSDYNCVKYRGGSRKNRRFQRGGTSGNGGYGFVLDNQYTGKFYDSLVKGPCPQRGAAYPPYINQAKMSYSVNNSSVSTPSAHFAVVAANPSYCGGRYSRKGRKGSRKGSRRGSKKLSRRSGRK